MPPFCFINDSLALPFRSNFGSVCCCPGNGIGARDSFCEEKTLVCSALLALWQSI